MKLLLSGATGFIGKHLVKRLQKEGHDIYIIVQSLTNTAFDKSVQKYVSDGDVDRLSEFVQSGNFDGVIHLASLFLAQHKTSDIKQLIDTNVFFATSLLESSVKGNVPWFINTGTFWQHYDNKDYSPANLYAATKQAFEDIARYYYETSSINFVTVKLCDTFGPGDIRPKIFNLWLKISQTKETLDMSAGEQLIDINYIDNVVDGYIRLIELLSADTERKLSGKSFAIRAKERMSLRSLAQLFEKTTKTKLLINWGKKSYRPREIMVPWENGNIIPGWEPKVSIEEGIRRTFDQSK